MMRGRLRFGLAALVIVSAACSGSVEDVSAPAGDGSPAGPRFPDSSFIAFDGTPLSIADFAGSPVVVNFWASWCPSCVAEMSSAFRPVAADLGGDVTFVGMNLQDDRREALDMLERTGVEWVDAEDPDGDLYRSLGGLGMPFTVFVGAGGAVLDRHNGPLTERQLRDRIEELFG